MKEKRHPDRVPRVRSARAPSGQTEMKYWPKKAAECASILETVFSFSPYGIAFISPDLVFRVANQNFAQLSRRPLDQIADRPAGEVVADWEGQIEHVFQEVRQTGKPFHSEAYPFTIKDQPERGLTCWDVTIAPSHDSGGNFFGWLLMLREVTERVRAEEDRERLLDEVQRRVAELDATLNSMAEGVVVYDSAGKIERVNAAAERILGHWQDHRGLSFTEWLGLVRVETAEGNQVAPERFPPTKALRGEAVAGVMLKIQRPDGAEVWISTSAAPIRTP
ncbi:MAG TPA: PAS domain-containing protein, partial [Chloroflexota bacterium]|nr:PAS domain-containing protein [Chloroflexota bacterium]